MLAEEKRLFYRPLFELPGISQFIVYQIPQGKKKKKKEKGLIFKTLHKFICLLWSRDFSGLFGIKTFCLCDIFGGIDNRFVSHGYEYGNVRVSH